MKKIITITYLILLFSIGGHHEYAAEKPNLLKLDWSFNGLFGKLVKYQAVESTVLTKKARK